MPRLSSVVAFLPFLLGVFAGSRSAAAAPGEIGVTRHPTGLEGLPEGFGIGLQVGEPSGLALALRRDEVTNLQAALAWSFSDARLHINADYTRALFVFETDDAPNVRFPFYVGLGGRVRIAGDSGGGNDNNRRGDDEGSSVGARVPIGITVLPREQRVDVYLEGAPVLLLLPEADVGWDAALGVRFYL